MLLVEAERILIEYNKARDYVMLINFRSITHARVLGFGGHV